MSFGAPLFLIALVLVPLALLAYLRHEVTRRAAAAAFAMPAVQASVAPRTPGWRRHAPLAAYALALTILILALAKPQTTVAVPIERASIMLATDYSGSMQATDVAPTRLEAARAAALKFLDEVPGGVRIGLVAFNGAASLIESPTTDRAAIRNAVSVLKPSGSTATGDALTRSLDVLARQTDENGVRVPAAIILLSDGKSVRGTPPTTAAARAKQLKIPIYTVTLGTAAGTIDVKRKDGSTVTRPVPPDPFESSEVARISGGRAYTADTAKDLSAVYETLGSRIGYRDEEREITAAFTGGALALLAGGGLLSLHWFRRLV